MRGYLSFSDATKLFDIGKTSPVRNVAWGSLYYQQVHPQSFLSGRLLKKADYERYLSLPETGYYYDESPQVEKIKGRAKGILLGTPLCFSRAQLEELVAAQ